jgi:hypothetical protein
VLREADTHLADQQRQTIWYPPRTVFAVPYNDQYHAVCALVPTDRSPEHWPMEGHIHDVVDPLRALLLDVAVPETAFEPTRMHDCHEEADLNPNPGFHARCQLDMGNQWMFLGALVNESGTTVRHHVVEKTILMQTNPLVGWEVAPPVPETGRVRRTGDVPVKRVRRDGITPPCDVRANLSWLMENASRIPNLLPILGVKVDGIYLVVYSPWCEGGDVRNALARFGEAATREILAGAMFGLQELNTKFNFLHYNIKPSNIFVAGCLQPVGVIGSLDNVVQRNECIPTTHRVFSTPCYGAPFQHCDPRRDQVAFLLTLVEVLSEVPWHAFCEMGQIRDRNQTQRRDADFWGWAAGSGSENTPGMHHRFWPTPLYRAYLNKVKAHHGISRVRPAGFGPKTSRREFALDLLDALTLRNAHALDPLIAPSQSEHMGVLNQEWQYTTVYTQLMNGLRPRAPLAPAQWAARRTVPLAPLVRPPVHPERTNML